MARVLHNPLAGSVGPEWGPSSGSSGAAEFHRRLPGYRATPLVPAPLLAARFGVGYVLVKDESNRYGLPAFKMLGASWAAYCLLVERLGRSPVWRTIDDLAAAFAPLRPLELVTATDGNHGRAVARVARLFGLGARVFVAEGTAPVRVAAIESEGATVEEVAGDYDAAVARSASVAAGAGLRALLVSDTSWEGYVDAPRRVIEGYDTIFTEIDSAITGARWAAPDVVIIPVGVGALAAAAVVHYRLEATSSPAPLLVAVEPEDADCFMRSVEAGRRTTVAGPHHSMMVGLNCGTPSLLAWPLISAGLEWCVTVEDHRAAEAMRLLAQEGIVSGETGAAAVAGLGALIDASAAGLGSDSTVLVLSTEGATDEAHYREIVGRDASDVVLAGHRGD